jgi:DMSO/TMAO reductase YedYZ heme-binding membrane subunit
MPKTAKSILLVVAAFILVVFAVFLFNQTMEIVQSTRAINVALGDGVMWALIFTYCILLTTPLVLWFRLPKRTLPPATPEGEDYDRFLLDFKKRL